MQLDGRFLRRAPPHLHNTETRDARTVLCRGGAALRQPTLAEESIGGPTMAEHGGAGALMGLIDL